jgi:hypothetical protein
MPGFLPAPPTITKSETPTKIAGARSRKPRIADCVRMNRPTALRIPFVSLLFV